MQRDKQDALRGFKEFLGYSNLINVYCMACAQAGRNMRVITQDYEPKDWIMHAFNVHQSHEGVDFWVKIDDTWQEHLGIIQREYRRM